MCITIISFIKTVHLKVGYLNEVVLIKLFVTYRCVRCNIDSEVSNLIKTFARQPLSLYCVRVSNLSSTTLFACIVVIFCFKLVKHFTSKYFQKKLLFEIRFDKRNNF